MACIVLAVIILMSIVLGAELGPKADPTTTTYTPRPEWYFFFLFELLRVVKPPALVFIATVGIPTICLVLLLLLPFFDRSPERHPLRRPIATHGRHRHDRRDGLPDDPRAPSPARRREIDLKVAAAVRAGQGGDGLLRLPRLPQGRRERQHGSGPNLTKIGDRLRQRRDRADAREPDGADAVVHQRSSKQNPQAVRRARRLRRLAQERQVEPRGAARGRGHAARARRCGRCSTASRASTT